MVHLCTVCKQAVKQTVHKVEGIQYQVQYSIQYCLSLYRRTCVLFAAVKGYIRYSIVYIRYSIVYSIVYLFHGAPDKPIHGMPNIQYTERDCVVTL